MQRNTAEVVVVIGCSSFVSGHGTADNVPITLMTANWRLVIISPLTSQHWVNNVNITPASTVHSTVQYSTVQYSTVQYSTVHHLSINLSTLGQHHT